MSFSSNSNTYELLQCEDLSKEIKKSVGIRRTQVKDQIYHFPIEKVEKTYQEFQNDDEGYMFRGLIDRLIIIIFILFLFYLLQMTISILLFK